MGERLRFRFAVPLPARKGRLVRLGSCIPGGCVPRGHVVGVPPREIGAGGYPYPGWHLWLPVDPKARLEMVCPRFRGMIPRRKGGLFPGLAWTPAHSLCGGGASRTIEPAARRQTAPR